MSFKVGQTIWRGYRYWVDLGDIVSRKSAGWNTDFIPYRVTRITKQQIICTCIPDSIHGQPHAFKDKLPLSLRRQTMEIAGKQYHTRYHEYFYATKPSHDPEQGYRPAATISILKLPSPFTAYDVNREYKRLARKLHPDGGGSHEQFIELQRTRDEALRLAMP